MILQNLNDTPFDLSLVGKSVLIKTESGEYEGYFREDSKFVAKQYTIDASEVVEYTLLIEPEVDFS